MTRPAAPAAGYTLIELLMVIAIIGVLAALTVAAVSKVQDRQKDLKVRADLTGLETAIESFRAKMNCPIPSSGDGPLGTFRLRTRYATVDASGNVTSYDAGFSATSPEIVVLKRLFPRIRLQDNGLLNAAGNAVSADLDGNQCMVFFLSGGSFTEYNGFATDPAKPFAKGAASRLGGGSFFEGMKPERLKKPTEYTNDELISTDGWAVPRTGNSIRYSNDIATSDGATEPWFIDAFGNPYLYMSMYNGNDYPFDNGYTNSVPALQTKLRLAIQVGPWGGTYSAFNPTVFPGGGYAATDGPRPYRESATKFRNSKTYQIISAGRDGIWGVGQPTSGAVYTPGDASRPEGPGSYVSNKKGGGDDMANFLTGRLGSPE